MDLSTMLHPRAAANKDKQLRALYTKEYPLYGIYLVIAFIFSVMIVNLFSSIWSIYSVKRRKYGSQGTLQEKNADLENRNSSSLRAVSFRRIPLALLETARIAFFRVVMPFFGAKYTMSEVAISIGYLLVMLVLSFYNCRNTSGEVDPEYYANRAGVIATSQLSFIVALAGKNNVITMLTGVGYEKQNILHRSASRTLLILSWVHTFGRVKIGLKGNSAVSHFHMAAGVVALVAYTLVVLIGMRQLRNLFYEYFFVAHNILVLLFLLFLYFHVRYYHSYAAYSWPPLVPWAFDRVFRLARTLHIKYLCYKATGSQGSAHLETLSANTLRVKVRLARTAVFPVNWRAGQSAYLSVPAASPFGFSLEAHPFTIASIDTPLDDLANANGQKYVELMFIVRAREGFTKRLYEYAKSQGESCTVTSYIDGPYGAPPSLRGAPRAILVAGGSGVAFTLPLLLDLPRLLKTENTICSRVLFIWYIRNLECVDWISDVLLNYIQKIPSGLEVDIRISVTNTSDPSITVPTLESKPCISKDDTDMEKASSPTSETSSEELGSKLRARSVEQLLSNPLISITRGRINLSDILEEEVSVSSKSVSVCVSGPQSLIDDVRGSLGTSRVTGPLKVLRGGANVDLHVETFGW